jgi:hypothetical protein
MANAAPATPTKSVKVQKTKAPATPKAEGEKKPRAPRQDYGYNKDATIRVTAETDESKSKNYRGQRLDWYEKLKKSDGKTCAHFEEANKGKDSPRGWLRFFVQDGAATLDQSTVPPPKPKAEAEPKA